MQAQLIPIASIDPNPDQPRKTFNAPALHELAASIRENGLIQPIKVRRRGDRFEIIAGERRWRAHRILADRGEAETVRAIVEDDVDDETMDLQAIVENLQRADVAPLEEAAAFQRMIDRGMTPEELARKIGVPLYRVDERTGLLKLDEQIQKLVASEAIAPTAGFEISKLPKHQQLKVLRAISSGKLRGIVEIRAAVRAALDELSQTDIFGASGKASKGEVDTLNRMEAKIARVADMVATGWHDGECVAARKVSPDRAAKMAEQITAIRRHLQTMERQLRQASAQIQMVAE